MIEHYDPAIGFWWTDPFIRPATVRGRKRKYLLRPGHSTGLNPIRGLNWNPFAIRVRTWNYIHVLFKDGLPF